MKLMIDIFRKHVIIFCALYLLILNSNAIYAQCDECIDRRIYMFDASVDVPAPPDTAIQEIFKWSSLFDLGRFARILSHDEDPTKDCFIWSDGGMWLANSAQNGTLIFGSTYTNLPPAGPIKGIDYLLTGSVTPDGGDNYTFTWRLECGTSREVVKSSSVNYTANSGGTGIEAAARQAAQGLMPFLQTIQDFEIDKRENDVTVARSAWGKMTITSKKTKLAPNESTEVEIELIDECDGYVLKNREIILEPYSDPELGPLCEGPTGGTVSPTRVTTDENGKATVTFTAGSSGGLGVINAVYVFKKPHGRLCAITGKASINLAFSMWDVTVKYSQDSYSFTDMTSTGDGRVTSSTGNSLYHAQGKMSFVYENKDPNNAGEDTLIVSAPDDPDMGEVHGFSSFGTSTQIATTRIETKSEEGELLGFYHMTSRSSGVSTGRENVGLWFEKKGSMGIFQLGASQHEIGMTHIRISGIPDGGPVQIDNWTTLIGINTTSFDPNATFSSNGGNFSVEYLWHQVTSEEGTSSILTIRANAEFKGDNSPDAVENGIVENLPRKIILYQNYPNPFNPTTTIGFEIPKKSFVSLKIYNILGKEVMTLLNETRDRGKYEIKFDGSRLPSGVYLYRIQAGDYKETKKLLIMK